MKQIYLIGGPNGAGKTTAALQLLPKFLLLNEFVNADEIAKGLSPFNYESMAPTASKLMIQRMATLTQAGKSFAFETTCAGTNYVKQIHNWKEKGYIFSLIFLWLPTPAMAQSRVKRRVRQGGHNVPDETIERRFYSGIRNLLQHYLPLADKAIVFNSTEPFCDVQSNTVIAEKSHDKKLIIHNELLWKTIQEQGYGIIKR